MKRTEWFIVFCRPTPRTVVHEVYEDKDRAVARWSTLCNKGYSADGVSLNQRWLTRNDIEEKREAGITIIETE